MNRKWTPGPWVVVKDESAAQVAGFPCIYANDYTVVGTEGMYGDIEEDFANAHLIAAAPDLYEALADIDRWSRQQNIALPSPAIYAAIAKAEGRTE